MCRWAAYIGSPIYLEDVICLPGHSLVRQSHGATRCHTPVNADGFGMAWYGERAEPGLYRDIMPAWSDARAGTLPNLVLAALVVYAACAWGPFGLRAEYERLVRDA